MIPIASCPVDSKITTLMGTIYIIMWYIVHCNVIIHNVVLYKPFPLHGTIYKNVSVYGLPSSKPRCGKPASADLFPRKVHAANSLSPSPHGVAALPCVGHKVWPARGTSGLFAQWYSYGYPWISMDIHHISPENYTMKLWHANQKNDSRFYTNLQHPHIKNS